MIRHLLLALQAASITLLSSSLLSFGAVATATMTTIAPTSPTTSPGGFIHLDAPMKNMTRYEGETLRIKCEITGSPLPHYVWSKDGVPLDELTSVTDDHYSAKPTLWGSRLKISEMTVVDSGLYECEGANKFGRTSVSATLLIKPGPNPHRDRLMELELVETDGDAMDAIDPDTDIMFYGESPELLDRSLVQQPAGGGRASGPAGRHDNPARTTSDVEKGARAGAAYCQVYRGAACAQFVANRNIFVTGNLQLGTMEEQLTVVLTLVATMNGAGISPLCEQYFIPALCQYAFPLCDVTTSRPRPRRVCREDCHALQGHICRAEYASLLRNPKMANQQLLPNCSSLVENDSCIRLGLPHTDQNNYNDQKQACYNSTGTDYRGTVKRTISGAECIRWPQSHSLLIGTSHPEGHNFCRNPNDELSGPWCFISESPVKRELCDVSKCVLMPEDNQLQPHQVSDGVSGSILHIVIPCLAVPICVGIILLVVHIYKRNCGQSKRGGTASKRNGGKQPSLGLTARNNRQTELLVKVPPVPRLLEFPASSVRFLQDLGSSAYGKVYRGEHTRRMNNLAYDSPPMPVAVKTLRANTPEKRRAQFWAEAERSAELKHVNILGVVGCCRKQSPECVIYEYSVYGDLHEYLIVHSPHSDITSRDSAGRQQILHHTDMLQIVTQISSGMEYLASQNFAHGDLAARNVLVAIDGTMKISDIGHSRDAYALDYCSLDDIDAAANRRAASPTTLPVRWMPAEAIGSCSRPTNEADVWSFGVTMWEVYSYGLQPYFGYSNADAVVMIRAHEILPSPTDCPSRGYSLMVECWHQLPACRPTFADLCRRLRLWLGTGEIAGAAASSHGSQPSNHSGGGLPGVVNPVLANVSPGALQSGGGNAQPQPSRARQAYALYAQSQSAAAAVQATVQEDLHCPYIEKCPQYAPGNGGVYQPQCAIASNHYVPSYNTAPLQGVGGFNNLNQFRPNLQNYQLNGLNNLINAGGNAPAPYCVGPYQAGVKQCNNDENRAGRRGPISIYKMSSSPPHSSTSHLSSSVHSSRSRDTP